MPARVAEIGNVQTHGLKRFYGAVLERPLGNRDSQGRGGFARHRVVAVCRAGGTGCTLKALQREGEACSGHAGGDSKCPVEHGVVATSGANRVRQAAGIGLEHQARVVIEGVHEREVEGDAPC